MDTRSTLLVFFLLTSLADDRLHVGSSLVAEISVGDTAYESIGNSKTFELMADASGTVTVGVDSVDFDPFVSVRLGGRIVAEDDDGGVETNCRLVFDLEQGSLYQIVVVAKGSGTGQLELRVVHGLEECLLGDDLIRAAIDHRARAVDQAIDRGNVEDALRHRFHEVRHRMALAPDDRAVACIEDAIELATAAAAPLWRGRFQLEMGKLRATLAEQEESRRWLESALASFRSVADRTGELETLAALGELYDKEEDRARARQIYQTMLQLHREDSFAEGEEWALSKLAGVAHDLGDYRAALDLQRQRFESTRARHDRPSMAKSLERLAHLKSHVGDYDGVITDFHSAIEIFRELGDDSLLSVALGNLGQVYHRQSDYAKARDLYAEALVLLRKSGSRGQIASALGNLGLVSRRLGDLETARRQLEEALAIAREIGSRSQEAAVLGHLGLIHYDQGDLQRARASQWESLELAQALGEADTELNALRRVGIINHDLGDYDAARSHFERSLKLAETTGNRLMEASALGNLGHAYYHLDQLPQALETTQKALDLYRALGNQELEAEAAMGLGDCYYRLGDLEAARRHHDAAMTLFRKLRSRPSETLSLVRLADDALAQGRLEEASRFATEAVRRYRAAGDETARLDPLAVLTDIALRSGDADGARTMIDEAEAQLAHVSAKAGGIGEASGLRSRHVEWGRVAQNLTALEIAGSEPGSDRHRKAIEDGFQAAGRWKGQALLEGIVEHWSGGRNRRSIELRREIDERTSQRRDVLDRLSAGIREGVDDEALDELRTLTDDLAREIETLSDEWERMSTGDDGLTIPRGVSTADVRAVLDESTALIEFAEGTRALYGYAIGPTNARFVELGDRAAIVEKIDGYLGGISGPARLSSARELHERGRSLSELLLKPLLTDLPQTVDRLVIVPSAQLAGIAFEALVVGPDRPSEAIQLVDLQFVIDRYEVAYVPSSPVLVELGEGGSRTKPGRVLVLADPLYSGSPGVPAAEPSPSPLALLGRSRARLAADLPRLEKTRTEALVLVRLLAESEDESTLAAITSIAERRSGTVEGRLFELRLGQDASRARLLTDLRDYSVVHIAAHGYVDRSLPQRTGIALAYRSDGNDDLTIVDVLDLDLDANLVTLSACETAQGVVRAGEGVQSLARAFLYAGARSVVASLWQVEDRAAAETMEAFYRSALRDGASIGSALRKAKLEVRRGFSRRGVAGSTSLESESDAETAHPFYWAPLVHIGSLGSGPD